MSLRCLRFLPYVVFVLTSCLGGIGWAKAPNVVFILADDLGIGDVNCYGQDRCLIDTPNIDALAEGGLKFSNAYVNASVCTPTRLALMTGRYAWRFGPRYQNGAWGFIGPRKGVERFTLAKLLNRAGYQTGYVGKWHLGTVMTTIDGKVQGIENVAYGQPLKFGPSQFGFASSFILPGSLDMYPYAFVRNGDWVGEVTEERGWSAFNRIGPAAKGFEDHEVLETFYEEAEAFLARQSDEQPFFLYLALTAPHTPISPGNAWQGKSNLGVYGDFVMEVDHAVKRVRDALQTHGLDDNTLILFSSDHGPASYAGNILKATPSQIELLEEKGHYSNSVHRGYKFSVYEGGLHVPLIAHWSGRIPPGTETDALVGLNDLAATFAELASQELATDEAPDSISFAGLLQEKPREAQRENLILCSAQQRFVIRAGNWKLCLCPGSGARGVYGNRPSSLEAWTDAFDGCGGSARIRDLRRAPFVQLFNLVEDPHEDHNVAEQFPDRVEELIQILESQIATGRSTPGPRLENDRKVTLFDVRNLPAELRDRIVP